jgi:catechol 2,3-dioxygenase-like lactoylglutathione lyase family enzyme
MTSSNGFQLVGINHVNVTVPAAFELAAKQFYGGVLGLRQIPKPEGPRKNVGAWYEIGGLQLHLSIEDGPQNRASDRHVCYQVADIASAKLHFRTAGIEVIPDDDPIKGMSRFFARDPGGNLIEVTQGVVK